MVQIRTRFAPSPTGFLHIGGLRTALYSYAFAKSQKGKFILRIEDTDLRRFVPGATQGIYKMLKIFGLNWDEGPYIQSERVASGIYKKYAEKLVKDGHGYYCFCLPESKQEIEQRHQKKEIRLRDKCRNLTDKEVKAKLNAGKKPAIRLRVPDNEEVSFFDFVLKKKISWKTENIDEVMLLKSDGFPTYHLGVVVDDAAMKISHIIRGRDWLPSTPVHLFLFKYLNFPLPEIGHLTDILDPAGGKLSKRKGSVSCEEFLAEGYLPEAILNFIMLLGWAPKDNREIFSLADFVKEFPKGSLQTANPVFNRKKLDWFNGYYIRQKSPKQLLQLIKAFTSKGMSPTLINQTIPLIKDRLVKLSDYPELVDFLIKEPKMTPTMLLQKGKTKEETKNILSLITSHYLPITNNEWKHPKLEKVGRKLVEKTSWSVGDLFMTIRVAITGKTATPPLFESMEVLGKEKTLRRLKLATKKLS